MSEILERPLSADIALPARPACGPVAAEPVALPTAAETSVLGLVEMLLKNPRKADLFGLMGETLLDVVPRFLGIALASYAVFGVTLLLLLNLAPAEAHPHEMLHMPPARWYDTSGLGLVAGYSLGLVAASGICLPTFYFFGLLAGVRISTLQIIALVVRAKASAGIVLVGILPIYLAYMLGLLVFRGPIELIELGLYIGLALPFIAGLEGVRCIYRGILTLSEHQPQDWQTRRTCFLRRLTLSWSACYTLVSPVMVYRLWEMLARPM